MEDPRRGSSMPPGAAEIFAPSSPVQPPQACTALWHKRRRGDTAECLRCRFAPMAARSARAHREDSARARGLHPRRFAPMAARSARAHREDSTRSRRGMVLNSLRLVFSHLSGGVWRRPAPRPLRKISPPNGGAHGLLFFCCLLWGGSLELAFSNFFLRSP